ncbi:auxin response factor 2A-like [Gastrolobium bilobum]|uniref:auxin response factor 2A-like n=1 Tax=Gastrolobium bilobum TaxID=150636 RepID=UPI002AB1673B|nr:auxin response factor 2A-like [Gastrolobium bilobum]
MKRKRDMDGEASDSDLNQDVRDDLYTEVWHACSGPSVYVPRAGEKVFYFPQGHLEQVAVFTQHLQDDHMETPVYDLPSKILCRVGSVKLKAEAHTDEVFAQVTLVPEPQQDDLRLEQEDTYQIPYRTITYTFSKILTPSDTSTHGGFSIPRRHADGCFPPLDMTHQPPTQELVAKDMHGFEWRFRHIYRGQPKRHLLTSGWSKFVNAKKLVAGDACIFVSGENGELFIGIRRAIKQYNSASTYPSLISGQCMKLGILTSASHAIARGSMFSVYYRPWTNPFEFIIPLKSYMKSTETDYSIGMRVQMRFKVEESPRRYAGTIIGVEDIDSIRWPGSEWRRLKVQWDVILDRYMHPERVCPWWIEPLKSAKKKYIPISPLSKKACVFNPSLPGLSGLPKDDEVQNSANPASQKMDWDLQSQDYNTNQLPFLMLDPLHQSLGYPLSSPHEDLSTSSSNVNSTGSESQGWPSSHSKDENDVPFGQPGSCSRYKLFGVSLTDNQPKLPSQQFSVLSEISSLLSNPPLCITSGKTCKKCRSVNRSCTKVLKLGSALGRAINLSHFPGYNELISELDCMFDFGGSLINGSSGWHVTHIDADGDITLLGDYPWQDFQFMVQKMIICPKDGINNLDPSSSADPTSL